MRGSEIVNSYPSKSITSLSAREEFTLVQPAIPVIKNIRWLFPCSSKSEIGHSLYAVSGLVNREYGRRDPSRLPSSTLYPQKLALTSRRSFGRYSSLADSDHGI
jgi:hypothetical protein